MSSKYPVAFIRICVKKIKDGANYKDVAKEYGLPKSTVFGWARDHIVKPKKFSFEAVEVAGPSMPPSFQLKRIEATLDQVQKDINMILIKLTEGDKDVEA